MKYIKENEQGFMSFDAYFQYVESIRQELGEDLYLFASDPSRYDLSSPGSLHDAWVKSLTARSFYREEDRDIATPDVVLVLLGPHHDRIHTLSYFNVISNQVDFHFCTDGRKRDLLYHELRYENGHLEHEFVFSGGMNAGNMKIEIHCSNVKYEETILNRQ
jgi:hypothetical protein